MSGATSVRLGFVPLNDASTLIVARENGYFEAEGVAVDLVREASWATIRDKLTAGVIDGAHLLAPLALAMASGIGCERMDLVVPFSMNWENAAITLSSDLASRLLAGAEGAGLAERVRARAREGSSPLTFASVFPFSTHTYLLRAWMEQADIGAELRLTVVSPPRAADLLAEGVIEGFCAGEPWNSVAVDRGVGRIVAVASQLLPAAPDKVFAASKVLADDRPDDLHAITRALIRASAWVRDRVNQRALAAILSRNDYLDVDAALLERSLSNHPPVASANRPDPSHTVWLHDQMRRWGQLDAADQPVGAADLYRPDLYDLAVRAP